MQKKHILNFIEYNNAKDRRKKTIDTNYYKIIAKYQDSKTLSEKISDKKKAKGEAVKKYKHFLLIKFDLRVELWTRHLRII